MLTAVAIVVGLLFLVGIVGSVLPWVPGPLLVLAGALLWAVVTSFATVGAGRLAILGALALLTFLLDLVVGAIGARRYGATRWGMMGALVGAIVGLLLGPLGLLLGGVAGAVVGELMGGADLAGSVRSGVGALAGMLAGVVADLVVTVTMIGLFLYWAWSG